MGEITTDPGPESDRGPDRELVVGTCDDCGEERLTAHTTFGGNLCSECMRRVPMAFRPAVAKRLGYSQQATTEDTADAAAGMEGDSPESKQGSPTAAVELRDILVDAGDWCSTTDLAERTAYQSAYVREVLRDGDDIQSRNRGGPRPTEWAYPDRPGTDDPTDRLPDPKSDGEWDGGALRDARKAAELTQRELAARVGVSQGVLSKWERGVSEPAPEAVDALTNALSDSRT